MYIDRRGEVSQKRPQIHRKKKIDGVVISVRENLGLGRWKIGSVECESDDSCRRKDALRQRKALYMFARKGKTKNHKQGKEARRNM